MTPWTYIAERIRTAEEKHMERYLGLLYQNASLVHIHKEDFMTAVEYALMAMRRLERMKHHNVAESYFILTYIYLSIGQWNAAERYICKARRYATDKSIDFILYKCDIADGCLQMGLTTTPEAYGIAEQLVQAHIEDLRQRGHHLGVLEASALLGIVARNKRLGEQ